MKHVKITFMDNLYFYVRVPETVLNHKCPDDERMRWVMDNFNNVKRIEWCAEPNLTPLIARQFNGNMIIFFTDVYPVLIGPDNVDSLMRQQNYAERVDKFLPGRIKQMTTWYLM